MNLTVCIERVAEDFTAKSYGHTLWIDDKGKIIDLGNSNMHYGWIAENWDSLFPDVSFSESDVYDVPHERGWIHVRNHTRAGGTTSSNISITGQRSAIKKKGKLLRDIVFDAMEQADDHRVLVDISFNDRHRDGYVLPKDMDSLMRVL